MQAALTGCTCINFINYCDFRSTRAEVKYYYLPFGIFRRCICSMNLLVSKRIILVDHAPVAGQELGRGGVLQGEIFAE
jgi:hypothetical protein